ncbi:hypothetical protein PFISCL1PPCAC_13226, partial [Pristionchus fissidentatus]
SDLSFQLEAMLRESLARNPKRVGILNLWMGPVPIVFLFRARHVKVLLESSSLISKPTWYDRISEWIGLGLLTSTGDKWHSRRKLITPTFHFNVLKGYCEVFVAQGRVFVDQLESVADSGREVDLFPFIKRCALDIICETAMGTQLNTQTGGSTEYCDAVTRISAIIFESFLFPWLWFTPTWYATGKGFEFDRLVRMTQSFTMKVIHERRRNMEEDGLFDDVSGIDESKSKKNVFIDMLLLRQRANALTDEDI